MAATYTISAYININIEGLLCERCRNGAQLLKISEGYDILLTFTKYFLNIFLVRLHSMEFRAYDLFFGHLFIRSAAWGIYRICVWACSCVFVCVCSTAHGALGVDAAHAYHVPHIHILLYYSHALLGLLGTPAFRFLCCSPHCHHSPSDFLFPYHYWKCRWQRQRRSKPITFFMPMPKKVERKKYTKICVPYPPW